MEELNIEEMTSIKGGFFDTNNATVSSTGNSGTATAAAVNSSIASLAVTQVAAADADAIVGNVHAHIRQRA